MIKTSRFVVVCVLLLLSGLFINLHSDIYVPTNKPFAEFPVSYKGWHMVEESFFSTDVLKVLKPTDYLYRKYESGDGSIVYLYIGYHGGGKTSGEVHSPKNCLPGGGWYRAAEQEVPFDTGQRRIAVVKAVYQREDQKDLFLYWYQVKGRALSDEYLLKTFEIVNSILYRRRDAAFIRVSVPVADNPEAAFQAGMKFLGDFYPVIKEFLPQ